MKIFCPIGAFASGKTTLTLKILKTLNKLGFDTKNEFAYVVNDAGEFVDGELGQEQTKVIAMTNGCFTCSDTADLKRNLEQLKRDGIQWVFLEGFGLTAGNETREFLESNKWSFHIVCTLSFEHFKRDLVRYSKVIESQVKATTDFVGITKYPKFVNKVLDIDDHQILDFVAKQNTGLPILLLPSNNEIPQELIDIFTNSNDEEAIEEFEKEHQCQSQCGCSDHNHNKHDHHHELFYSYSFNVLENISLHKIKDVFKNKDYILRIKGAVDGFRFNAVYDTWKQDEVDTRSFITMYSHRRIILEKDLPELLKYIEIPDNFDQDASYLQLRKENDISYKETVSEIKELLREIPEEPIVISSNEYIRILTHPELLQTLKDGIGRRSSVKDEWFPYILKKCMIYWIKCAKLLNTQNVLPQDLGKNLRELSVSLIWWINRYADYFGKDIVEATKILKPSVMGAKGILMMESLNSDPERAKWQYSELKEVLIYGISTEENIPLIIKALDHCRRLAIGTVVEKEWQEMHLTITPTN